MNAWKNLDLSSAGATQPPPPPLDFPPPRKPDNNLRSYSANAPTWQQQRLLPCPCLFPEREGLGWQQTLSRIGDGAHDYIDGAMLLLRTCCRGQVASRPPRQRAWCTPCYVLWTVVHIFIHSFFPPKKHKSNNNQQKYKFKIRQKSKFLCILF